MYFCHHVQGGIVRDETTVQESSKRAEVGGGGATGPGCTPHLLLCNSNVNLYFNTEETLYYRSLLLFAFYKSDLGTSR